MGSAAAPWANGRTPLGGLVEGPDGYLYGATNTGGLYGRASSGAERPEAIGLPGCEQAQDLSVTCP